MLCILACSFKQKKIKDITRAGTEKFGSRVRKSVNGEKAKNIFRFCKKPLGFRKEVLRNLENFGGKMRYQRKFFIVYERANDGLSSNALISISIFLTETDFF
jgi:hypothetical protein